MNSSGLIYAVIVGAWAAYLVPMWLRRQDELNESRPTERFSTAIRLLSGKAAMERRYGKETEQGDDEAPHSLQGHGDTSGLEPVPGRDDAHEDVTDPADEAVDVRAYADPKTMIQESGASASATTASRTADRHAGDEQDADEDESRHGDAGQRDAELDAQHNKARQNGKRAQVLARRRRTTMVLFLAFTAGTIVAAVGGLAFLWAPAVPGLLLSAYIVHLRVQERRRFAITMDKRQGEAAAKRLRERRTDAESDDAPPPKETAPFSTAAREQETRHTAAAEPAEESGAAGRRALVEQTDHAEWVDQQRQGDREPAEGWDPVPVPLPTYVSAPVAPRNARGVDLEAPGTWSSARSSAAGTPSTAGQEDGEDTSAQAPRRGRGHERTPLFDQYEGEDRPRAVNE